MLIDRLLQMAPFNQIDGAWLRNAGDVGPIDEVHSLLFNVWMDEVGGGDPKLNHSNIYTHLLRSVGIDLEPVASGAYVENPAIVDAAFTSPLFQLTISQFSEEYLPEILGMTLYLEWAVVGLKPQVERMEAFGIDPLFFRLHIGIDNASTGHGAMARRAVELYMDEVRASSGDRAMRDMWRRVWDGYVAFGTTGELADCFRSQTNEPQNPAERVRAMIQRKEHFGSQNHGRKRLGQFNQRLVRRPEGLHAGSGRVGLYHPRRSRSEPFLRAAEIHRADVSRLHRRRDCLVAAMDTGRWRRTTPGRAPPPTSPDRWPTSFARWARAKTVPQDTRATP